jgi:simple sugar transport system permease protein
MGEVAGVHRYLLEGISPGYGYLAIAVALFGGLNPLGVVLSALFFGALMVGADAMQRAVGVPVATIYLLQGLVVIFVLARQVLRRRRRTLI